MKLITIDNIKIHVCPNAKFGPLLKLISARDSITSHNSDERSHLNICAKSHNADSAEPKQQPQAYFDQDTNTNVGPWHAISSPIRIFGSHVTQTDIYQESGYFPPAHQEINDPLHCIQRYIVPKESCISNVRNIHWLQKIIVEFASSCANDRTNGTLYVGVGSDGKVVGVKGNQTEITDAIQNAVHVYCYDDEADTISKCIQSPKFVPVKSQASAHNGNIFVLEIDVAPEYNVCAEEVFWVKDTKETTTRSLFRFKQGIPTALSQDDIKKFMGEKNRLALQQKQVEQQQQQLMCMHNPQQDQMEKLRMLLCRGGHGIGDISPILVTNSLPEFSSDKMREQFHFLKELDWKFVLDFDPTGKLYSYLDEEEQQVLTVLPVDEFDPNNDASDEDTKKLQNTLLDNKSQKWLFANGYNSLDVDPLSIGDWKKCRGKALREVVRLIKQSVPVGRAMVIFMLFSPQLEMILEAAEELTTEFQNVWFSIADVDSVMDDWVTGLCQKHLVKDRTELIPKSVNAISWSEVNTVVCNLTHNIELGLLQMPSSDNGRVSVTEKMTNLLTDLQLLSATHCADADISKERREQLFDESQQAFYRGAEADWWNFHFGHVIHRNCVTEICNQVKQKMSEPMEDERVTLLDLYHQPGAGGSTVAKHVLWKLKGHCRCIVVCNITDQTATQIQTIHNHKDNSPKPVLLLLDNKDDEAINNLKADLEEKNRHAKDWELDIERRVFFVFLCIRRSSAKENKSQFYLKQELTPVELGRFKKCFSDLTKRFKETSNERLDPKHLISFNIMKENFDENYITKTVSHLISEICDNKELELLTYIAMINSYDINFQSIPVSAFDELMESRLQFYVKRLVQPKWEDHLSMPLGTLLTHENGTRQSSGRCVRIIHGKVSQNILEQLLEKDDCTTLADIFDKFLSLSMFKHRHRNMPVKYLLRIVADVVKKRIRDPQTNKPDTNFARLIQEILDDPSQGQLRAIDILICVYELSGDVYVGQQLARMYTHCKNWDKAREIGKAITTANPNCSYLQDTYGLSYFKSLHQSFAEIENMSTIAPHAIVNTLKLAINALHIFQEMQRVGEAEKANRTLNIAGYTHELDTICKLLSCLSRVQGLNVNILRNVLNGIQQMPSTIVTAFGVDMVGEIFQLQYRTDITLARVEEHMQYNQKVARSYGMVPDLNKYQAQIGSYFQSEGDIDKLPQRQACNVRRGIINMQLGRTYSSIFKEHKDPVGRDKLASSLKLLEANLSTREPDMIDINKFLIVTLTICCINFDKGSVCDQRKMAEYARLLYKSKTKLPYKNLEPYLHAAMLNWPQKCAANPQPMKAGEVNALLHDWDMVYKDKHPILATGRCPRPEKQMIFLGTGSGMQRYVFYENMKISKDRPINESPQIASELDWFAGILLERGSKVRFDVAEQGNITRMDIPTYRQVRTSSLFYKKVFFAIVFTWAGPKAVGVCHEDPSKCVYRNTRPC